MDDSLYVVVTELQTFLHRWKKVASYLKASTTESANLDDCVNLDEVWRGALVIREKKVGHLLPNAHFHRKCCTSVSFFKMNALVAVQNTEY